MQLRICAFSNVYNTLVTGKMFLIPDNIIPGTNVAVSYLLYEVYSRKDKIYGMNVGLRNKNTYYMPLTILMAKPSNKEKYINNGVVKKISQLFIYDSNNNLIKKYIK